MRVTDVAGVLEGVRPPGGGIEFGETAIQALHREFREELHCAIEILGAPNVLENIFEHNGAPGHEIVFAFPIAITDPAVLATERFVIVEAGEADARAEWLPVGALRAGEVRLFPPALVGIL